MKQKIRLTSLEDWDRRCLGLSKAEYLKTLRRRKWRQVWECAKEIIGALLVMVEMAILGWLLLAMPE